MRNRVKSSLEHVSEKITASIGSLTSILIHTVFFAGIFALRYFGLAVDDIMLILTTVVSLEAIYLAIFIQMTVNRNTQSLEGVEEDIEDISEDIEELGEEVEDISEDIDEISEDIDKMGEEVEDLGEELEDIGQDMDKIQAEEAEDARKDSQTRAAIDNIETSMQKLMTEIEALKQSIRK